MIVRLEEELTMQCPDKMSPWAVDNILPDVMAVMSRCE
jgi:hypothetical protein